MSSSFDESFIRRAVELADLNAVKVALFQQVGDPVIGSLPMALEWTDEQRSYVVDAATAWLLENATTEPAAEPPPEQLRRLMDLATDESVSDLDFAARRELPAFTDFPLFATWDDEAAAFPEGFRVAVIGSGLSGLAMAMQLELLGIPYDVFEKRPDAGGVWSHNRYPGLRVDTTSITYEFSFEKDYRWSEYYSPGTEVRRYLNHVSEKFGITSNAHYEHTLADATWDETAASWRLTFETPKGPVERTASVLINAVGAFANPSFGDFEGQEDFAGPILHPSRWPEDIDLDGKRIAVIGNGSTGVQLVKPMAAAASQLTIFSRTPQWITPRVKYGDAIEPEVAWLLDHFPGYWNWWRYMAIAALFKTHDLVTRDPQWQAQGGTWSQASDELRAFLTSYIAEQTGGDEDLMARLTPDHAPFSRRLVVDNGWYAALQEDHVRLESEGIERFTETGITTVDGEAHDFDVIVTATGFEVGTYLAPARYLGRDGVDIHDQWSADGPRAYLSMMAPNFPNMFMVYGPNSQPLSGGTGLPQWFVLWASYIAKCIMGMLHDGSATVEVSQEAHDRYNRALDEEASGLLLLNDEHGAPGKNYYVNDHGRLQVNAPWYGPEFHRLCSFVDWDDVVLDRHRP
ncbi:MAG: NAD(P)/FAD-dependent oxidoreductase [Actinomycetota bacterium]